MNKSILKGSWSCRAKCTAGRRTIGATKIISTKTTTTTRTNGLASLFVRSQTETKQLLINCWFQINLFSVTGQFGQPGIIMYCHLNFPRPAPIWPYSSVGRATVICYGDRGFESHQDQRVFFSFSVWALSPPQRLRKRDRENRVRGIFHLPRDLRALTILFTSPPIYLFLSLALQPAPLEKFQGTSAEKRGVGPFPL